MSQNESCAINHLSTGYNIGCGKNFDVRVKKLFLPKHVKVETRKGFYSVKTIYRIKNILPSKKVFTR